MEIRIETRTAEGVREAIQNAMRGNRRSRVFRAVGNAGAGLLSVSPCAEDTDTWGDSWHGYTGIQRHAWENVPGYAEDLADRLAAILQKKKGEGEQKSCFFS